MKKFLIGIVFIIPIIIVLAITATGRIIALNHPLNAGRMELRDFNNEVIEQNVNDIFAIDASDDATFIIIELFPSITDQKIIYTINDEIPNACPLELVQIEDTNHYRFVPQFDQYGMALSGVAEITIYAANNVSVKRTITVIVKSEVITDMHIYGSDGDIVEDTLELYAPTQLYCDVNPMDALDYQGFEWSGSNPSVVKVSSNGLLTPMSRGEAVVSVTAKDKKGDSHTTSIVVSTANAVVKAVNAKTSAEISVGWIQSNLLLSQAAEVSDLGGGNYAVSENGATYNLCISQCDYDEVIFAESLSTLYTQNGPYFIELEFADIARKNESPSATYEVSDPTVLRLDAAKNMLVPLKAGTAKLIAKIGGGIVETTVVIKERPYAFNLMYTTSDAKLGVSQSRTWGLNWLAPDNSRINTLQFGCSLPKDTADIKWESSNPDFASIDNDALITFFPEAAGHTVTMRATVLVNNYKTNIYREFSFKMAEGESSVNVYNYDQFLYVSENSADDIVMQNSIKANSHLTYIRGSVYGNGFLYDAKGLDYYGNPGILRLESEKVEDTLRKFVFHDLWVEAAENFEESAEKGSALVISKIVNPIEIKYCILQYCATGLRLQNTPNVLIEGCIMGYSANSSIEITKDTSTDHYITLKNNVMRQSNGPAISMAPDNFLPEYFDRNTMPNIKIEGFFDVTNWKTPDDLSGLLAAFDPAYLSGIAEFLSPEKVIEMLANVLKDLFSRDDMSYLLYTNPSDGNQYVCLGIFALGIYARPNKDFFKFEDSSLVVLPVVFPRDDSPLGILSAGIDAVTRLNLDMTIYNPNYLVSYDFSNGKKPKYGPGDSIPQDFELYHRLVHGNSAENLAKR